MKVVGRSDPERSGTKITFQPDGQIFKQRTFKFETIAERLRELAFLNPQVRLRIIDLRNKSEQEETFHFEGGLVEFVSYIDATRPSIMRRAFTAKGAQNDESGRPVEVEAAFQYNDQYNENIFTSSRSGDVAGSSPRLGRGREPRPTRRVGGGGGGGGLLS